MQHANFISKIQVPSDLGISKSISLNINLNAFHEKLII